jgi:hypothetical protein
MTHSPTPSATNEQIIERLATEVMGWHKVKARSNGNRDAYVWATHDRDQNEHWDFAAEIDWNPLTDWNHWRQVEKRVMEDEDLWELFCINCCRPKSCLIGNYMQANLPTRIQALIAALDSLQKND